MNEKNMKTGIKIAIRNKRENCHHQLVVSFFGLQFDPFKSIALLCGKPS